jgi:hypothetical protein
VNETEREPEKPNSDDSGTTSADAPQTQDGDDADQPKEPA